jgi:hypothetical protein
MKILNYMILGLLFVFLGQVNAQEAQMTKLEPVKADTIPSPWTWAGNFSLLVNQAVFTNWTQGGETSLSGASFVNLKFNYKKDLFEWTNTLDLGYGLMKSQDYSFYKKTEDKIEYKSTVSHTLSKRTRATALASFNTQFAKGFNYPNDSIPMSTFMAPGYLTLSIGADYKPWEFITIFFTPVSGKTIFCLDQTLADQGKYIPMPAKYDTVNGQRIKISDGARIKFDFGMNCIIKVEKEIMQNVTLYSRLELFQNYTDPEPEKRWNFDVNWENKLNLKVNSHISANVLVHLLYDHDVKVPIYEQIDGKKVQVGTGPRLQFKELLGLGFTFKF